MIKCENCDMVFKDESDLSPILNISQIAWDRTWHTVDRILEPIQNLFNMV